MGTVPVLQVNRALEMVVMIVQQYDCIYYHQTVYLKLVKMENFMLCVFYHNKKNGEKINMGCPWDCNEFSARTTLSVLLTAQKQIPLSVSLTPPSC